MPDRPSRRPPCSRLPSAALPGAGLALCLHARTLGLGRALGTIVGVLPGFGPPAAMALLFPLVYVLEPLPGMSLPAGIFYGAKYGGAVTSILLLCLTGSSMGAGGLQGPVQCVLFGGLSALLRRRGFSPSPLVLAFVLFLLSYADYVGAKPCRVLYCLLLQVDTRPIVCTTTSSVSWHIPV